MSHRPYFFVYSLAGGLQRQLKDDGRGKQLRLELVEEAKLLVDETTMVGNRDDVVRQTSEVEKLLIFVACSKMVVEDICLLENFMRSSLLELRLVLPKLVIHVLQIFIVASIG